MAKHPHEVIVGTLINTDRIYARLMATVSGTIISTRHKSDTPVVGTSAAFDLTKNGVSIYGSKPTIATGGTSVSQVENTAVSAGDIIELSVDLSGAFPSVGGKLYSMFEIEDGLPTYFGGTSATSFSVSTGSKAFTTQQGLAYTVGSRMRVASSAAPSTNYMEGVVTAYSGTTLTILIDLVVGSGTHTDWLFSIAGDRGSTGATGSTGGTGATGAAGVVQSVVAGSNVTVDSTDPANPIVSSSGGGGGSWTTLLRGEGNQTGSNTTLTQDSVLKFTVTANKNYLVRGRFDVFVNGSNPGFKFDINFPNDVNVSVYQVEVFNELGGGPVSKTFYKNPTGSLNPGAAGFDRFLITFEGTFAIDGTGGTWEFRHAQVTSNASQNIIRGGFVEYAELP